MLPTEHSCLQAAPKITEMAEMAVLGVFFQHLYTSVNGVGKCDINFRDSSSAISTVVAHLCSIQELSDDTRHVAPLAVH